MTKPQRILVYGFGPYREFRENITARILTMLAARAGLKKIVFPVRFQRKQFVAAITRFRPDIVLGLGQSRRRTIDVEAQAANRRRRSATTELKEISRNSPAKLSTTLQLETGKQARRSTNAGDYVCNFSMYVMLDHIRRTGLDCRYAFVHIPHDHDVQEATRWVEKILRSCRDRKKTARRDGRRRRAA